MKLNTLKPTKGIRNWCGPSAMSMLTGRSVGYCAQLCAEYASRTRMRHNWSDGWHLVEHTRKTIRGVGNDELLHAMDKIGYKMIPVTGYRGLTLFRFFETMPSNLWKASLLINITNHYVVGKLGKVYDNRDPRGSDSRKYYCRKAKIESIWITKRRKK